MVPGSMCWGSLGRRWCDSTSCTRSACGRMQREGAMPGPNPSPLPAACSICSRLGPLQRPHSPSGAPSPGGLSVVCLPWLEEQALLARLLCFLNWFHAAQQLHLLNPLWHGEKMNCTEFNSFEQLRCFQFRAGCTFQWSRISHLCPLLVRKFLFVDAHHFLNVLSFHHHGLQWLSALLPLNAHSTTSNDSRLVKMPHELISRSNSCTIQHWIT